MEDWLTPPLLYVGLYDDGRSSTEVLASAVHFFSGIGADVRNYPDGVAVYQCPQFSLTGEHIELEITETEGGGGGLVELACALGDDDDPAEAWRTMRDALRNLILAVRPKIATMGLEVPIILPLPGWQETLAEQFSVGWINLDKCTREQQSRFLKLRERGMAVDVDSGLWWSVSPDLGYARDSESASQREIGAAIYEAWTGLKVPPEPPVVPPPHVTEEDMAPREIWFWKGNYPAGLLQGDVYTAARPLDLHTEIRWDYWEPHFHTVVATYVPQGRTYAELVENLRNILQTGIVHPDWAGVLHRTGFAPVGVVSDDGGRVDFF